MHSELRNTAERNSIYKSWRGCVIPQKKVSIGICYKTVADVDDGFGDRTPACREFSHPRAESDSRIYAAIPERTIFGPVLRVHMVRFLGINGIEILIPSLTTQERTSRVVICREKNRYVDEIHLRDPGHQRVMSYFWKDLLQKKVNLVLQRWSNRASRKLMRRTPKFRRMQCTFRKKLFLLEKGSGMKFLPAHLSKETLFQPKSQNWSWDWYVTMIQMNEKLTALFIGIPWFQIFGKRFRSSEGEHYRTRVGFNTFIMEATR